MQFTLVKTLSLRFSFRAILPGKGWSKNDIILTQKTVNSIISVGYLRTNFWDTPYCHMGGHDTAMIFLKIFPK